MYEFHNTVVDIGYFCVYSNNWRELMKQLKALLKRLKQFNFSITFAKFEFASATVTFLGHVIGQLRNWSITQFTN